MTPEISIVVPVYNVERYLSECLDSIRDQTFKNWECILVDDGSPDGSGEICDRYAASDSRFRVIHRENGGLSAARNTGLKACRGRYIGFVDSDDSVKENMFERLLCLIKEWDADVAEVSFISRFTTWSSDKHLVSTVEVLDRGHVALELLYSRKIPSYVWNKLFKREVITVDFPEGQVFEDVYVMSRWIDNIHKMVISPEPLYLYRKRGGSISKVNSVGNRMAYLKSRKSMIGALHAIEPGTVTEVIANRQMFKSIIAAAKSIARFVTDKAERLEAMKQIARICDSYTLPGPGVIGLKLWMRVNLLRVSPSGFIRLMRLMGSLDLHKRLRNSRMFD